MSSIGWNVYMFRTVNGEIKPKNKASYYCIIAIFSKCYIIGRSTVKQCYNKPLDLHCLCSQAQATILDEICSATRWLAHKELYQ